MILKLAISASPACTVRFVRTVTRGSGNPIDKLSNIEVVRFGKGTSCRFITDLIGVSRSHLVPSMSLQHWCEKKVHYKHGGTDSLRKSKACQHYSK